MICQRIRSINADRPCNIRLRLHIIALNLRPQTRRVRDVEEVSEGESLQIRSAVQTCARFSATHIACHVLLLLKDSVIHVEILVQDPPRLSEDDFAALNASHSGPSVPQSI